MAVVVATTLVSDARSNTVPAVIARDRPGVLSAWPATQVASVAGPRPAAATTPGTCPPATEAAMIFPVGVLSGLVPGEREGLSLMYVSLKFSGIS